MKNNQNFIFTKTIEIIVCSCEKPVSSSMGKDIISLTNLQGFLYNPGHYSQVLPLACHAFDLLEAELGYYLTRQTGKVK